MMGQEELLFEPNPPKNREKQVNLGENRVFLRDLERKIEDLSEKCKILTKK